MAVWTGPCVVTQAASSGPIRGAEQLPHVPFAARLLGGLLLGERLYARRKWPQKMIEYAHTLRTRLAVMLPASVDTNSGPVSSGNTT
jgi:hypothetical protein